MKNLYNKVKKILFKDKLTIEEYEAELKRYSKKTLIKELICTAQKVNYNQCGVGKDFQKKLSAFSKKKLIKAIILIKVSASNHKFKKVVGL